MAGDPPSPRRATAPSSASCRRGDPRRAAPRGPGRQPGARPPLLAHRRDILARQRNEGWGAKVIDRLAEDLRRAFPGIDGLLRPEPQVHARLRRGLARPGYRATGRCTIALGPQRPPARGREGPPTSASGTPGRRSRTAGAATSSSHQIESGLYRAPGQGAHQLRAHPARRPSRTSPSETLKDPYNFDFLSLAERPRSATGARPARPHPRVPRRARGTGFAFVGQQVHLEVGGEDFYLDLLFYHLRLRCFVVIDLKTDGVQAGVRRQDELLPLGRRRPAAPPRRQPVDRHHPLQGRNQVVAEYALRDTRKPMGVARYRLSPALPDELRRELPDRRGAGARVPADVGGEAAASRSNARYATISPRGA